MIVMNKTYQLENADIDKGI